jgi:CheY-like chemotaxis protein
MDIESILRQRHGGIRVLIGDDDPDSLFYARQLIEAVGMIVDTAENGADLVAEATAGRYALVLLDVRMPGLDGLAATRQLRTMAAYRTTPILALTANVFPDDRARCLEAGINDVVAKPYEPQQLFTAVLKALSA